MRSRPIVIAFALLAILTEVAIAQEPLVVKMPGSDRENVVVPRTIAFATGLDITETVVGPLTGERTLAGYTINLDSKPCLLTQVSPAGIVFLVPENVRPSGVIFDRRRLLHLQGPSTLRFVEVVIERFAPILQKQGDYAIAAAGLFPQLYIGERIPVGPNRFNYVSLIARGVATGLLPLEPQLQLTVVLERSGERHEVQAEAFDVAGFPGTERVTFWAPSCANGDYQVSVKIDGHTSNSAIVRFTSDCPARVARPMELGRRR